MKTRFFFLAPMIFLTHPMAHAALDEEWRVESYSVAGANATPREICYKVISNHQNQKTLVINVEETMRLHGCPLPVFLDQMSGMISRYIKPQAYPIDAQTLIDLLKSVTKTRIMEQMGSPIKDVYKDIEISDFNDFFFTNLPYSKLAGSFVREFQAVVFFTPSYKEIVTDITVIHSLEDKFEKSGYPLKLFLQGANPFFE